MRSKLSGKLINESGWQPLELHPHWPLIISFLSRQKHYFKRNLVKPQEKPVGGRLAFILATFKNKETLFCQQGLQALLRIHSFQSSERPSDYRVNTGTFKECSRE